MSCYFRPFILLLLTLFISSCASTDKIVDESLHDETGIYKYDAWRPTNAVSADAINALLNEVDILIEDNAYDAAADKLERVLRIKPGYAPAWSRLSWLALQMDSPKRSIQMAKRSNSFAGGDPVLQSLNWTFIRAASKALNDEDGYHRANQKIDSLKAF